ncbi:MAG TPA: hypothetical protein VFU68_00120 [Terracidiphilus sp.]|nr:hypothetical protein [Terracidiphilus sp.]
MTALPPVNRVYGASLRWRLFALAFCGFGSFVFLGSLYELFKGASRPSILAAGFAFTLVGICLVIYCFQAAIQFTTDAIEHRTLFRTKRLPLTSIRGRKEYVVHGEGGGGTRYLRLVPDDDRLPVMDFSKSYAFDQAFFQWFYGLRDLDAEEKQPHKDSGFGLA